MGRSQRVPVALNPEVYEQVKLYAHKEGKSMSEVMSIWVEEGLKGKIGVDNLDLISQIIREQLKAIIEPYIDRLAALSAKGTLFSGTAMLLNAEAISRFVDPEQQMDIQEAYDRAKRKAAQMTKIKIEKEWYDV